MPDWAVKRQLPRYPIQLPVLHQPGATTAGGGGAGWTRNLSEGGACVELDERLPVPTSLQLRLQTEQGAIDLEAQVVWEMPAQGDKRDRPTAGGVLHGVAFTRLAPDQLQALRTLLLFETEERRAGVRLPLDLAVSCEAKGAGGSQVEGRTGNISRGGLLLRLSQELSPGTVLEVTLQPTDGPVKAEGEIVWVEPPEKRTPGEPIRHGLRFTALGWSRSLSLALLLAKPAGC